MVFSRSRVSLNWVAGLAIWAVAGGWGATYGNACMRWERRALGLSGRCGSAMAYDSGRGVAVMVGGSDTSWNLFDETWEWDGSSWMLVSTAGPSPRYGHAMAYDSGRGVTVLFGSRKTTTYHSDTWEWNGSRWTQRNTTGPPPRYKHTLAYDSSRGLTVLFGGYAGGSEERNDTWEWDGADWTLAITNEPPWRFDHAMAYDSGREVMTVVGGYSLVGWHWYISGKTWVWEARPLAERADLDEDGDVDGSDFLTFSVCYNGSLNTPASACLSEWADLDCDADVDGNDFLTFSTCYNGSLNPPRCP